MLKPIVVAILFYYRLAVINWSVLLIELSISPPIELDDTVSFQNKSCTDFPKCTTWVYWLRFQAAKYSESFLIDQPDLKPSAVAEYAEEDVYKDYSKPFVIRGAAIDLARKWGHDENNPDKAYEHMRTRFGDEEVIVARNLSHSDISKVQDEFFITTLRKYIDAIQKDPSLLDYVIFEDSFMDKYINETRVYVSKVTNRSLRCSQLFFGNKNSGSVWHYALLPNVFIEIYGAKHWCFIHPSEWINMRAFFNPYIYARSALYSGIERKIPRTCTTLYPGDILYNPPWTWHTVYNIETFNLGIATRIKTLLDYILPTTPGFRDLIITDLMSDTDDPELLDYI